MDGPSPQCRYLVDRFVPICSAFQGGIRTPRETELERLCRSSAHVQCPLFQARESELGNQTTRTDTVCRK
jgi:hypothetical protein